jgi:nitrous-oxide reductase
MRRRLSLALVATLLVSCSQQVAPTTVAGSGSLPADALAVAAERGLTADDMYAALSTYQPSGRMDDYILFSSGGQSGQVYVIGVPSMRILRSIAVFAPEPWQGYGYGDETEAVLRGGDMPDGTELNWGDTHHPNLSETNGEYDGEFLFINDKANARLAVIDLRDFETKQIIKNPNSISDHGGSFVTPNTEYVVEGPQYATPIGWEYAPVEEYNDQYRDLITFWKFDRLAGRVVEDQSFQIELPPYWQDLCDSGKAVSESRRIGG